LRSKVHIRNTILHMQRRLLFSYKKMLSPANCPRAQFCAVFLRRWHRLYDSGGMGNHGVPTGCALEPWHIRRPVGVQPMEVAGSSSSISQQPLAYSASFMSALGFWVTGRSACLGRQRLCCLVLSRE
jgi:hypothetical protein